MGVMVCGVFGLVVAAGLLFWWGYCAMAEGWREEGKGNRVARRVLYRCGRPLCYENLKAGEVGVEGGVFCPRCGHRVGGSEKGGAGVKRSDQSEESVEAVTPGEKSVWT